MTTQSFTRILAIAAMLVPLGLQAQSLSDLQNMTPEERHTYLDSMSEQERQAKREQWRAEREAMSEQERAAMREQMRAQRESMSDEERQAMRDRMRAHWDGMSEAERAAARNRAHHHHGAGRHKGNRQGGS